MKCRDCILAVLALTLVDCTEAPPVVRVADDAGASQDAGAAAEDAPTLTCEPERGILRVTDVLAALDDPCRAWIAQNLGRAVRVAFRGSASIWSRRTTNGTALMLTASHVYSRCTSDVAPRDAAGNCPETLTEPRNGNNHIRLTESGGVYASRWSPAFALYNNFMPADIIGTPRLLPRHEISLYVVDATTYEPWDSTVTPTPTKTQLPLYDPERLTFATPTWSEPAVSARVLTLGYPLDNGQSDLVASIGRVLSDSEVAMAQQVLRERGDEEGGIAYEPTVEFFFRGAGLHGMSGGGVFDEAGHQVGMVVRASQLESGTNYVRAVRMSYVVTSLQNALIHLPEAERARIEPYLETP